MYRKFTIFHFPFGWLSMAASFRRLLALLGQLLGVENSVKAVERRLA